VDVKRFTRTALVLLMVSGAGRVLNGHDIAIFPTTAADGARLLVRFGHPGDYQGAVAGKLITLDAFSPAGDRRSLAGRLRPDGLSLVTSPIADLTAPGTWVFSTFYDNGFLLQTTDGRSVNTTRAEYPAAEVVTHNVKYGKALLAVGHAGAGFDRRLGHRLELIPQQDPFTLPLGQALDVLVLYEGEPLAGAEVYIYGEQESDATLQRTADLQGRVRVALDRTGRFLIATEHEVSSRHPEFATRDNYAASLVFNRR